MSEEEQNWLLNGIVHRGDPESTGQRLLEGPEE